MDFGLWGQGIQNNFNTGLFAYKIPVKIWRKKKKKKKLKRHERKGKALQALAFKTNSPLLFASTRDMRMCDL